MTLDELLALLPDNTTGEIDAADLRTVVTELFNATAAVQTEADSTLTMANANAAAVAEFAVTTDARIDALEEATGRTRTASGVWRLNTTPGAAPSDGQVSTDTAAFTDATWLRFAAVDRNATDLTGALSRAALVSMQDKDNSANWAKWQVSGAVTQVGTAWEIPVTLTDSSGVLSVQAAPSTNDLVAVITWLAP